MVRLHPFVRASCYHGHSSFTHRSRARALSLYPSLPLPPQGVDPGNVANPSQCYCQYYNGQAWSSASEEVPWCTCRPSGSSSGSTGATTPSPTPTPASALPECTNMCPNALTCMHCDGTACTDCGGFAANCPAITPTTTCAPLPNPCAWQSGFCAKADGTRQHSGLWLYTDSPTVTSTTAMREQACLESCVAYGGGVACEYSTTMMACIVHPNNVTQAEVGGTGGDSCYLLSACASTQGPGAGSGSGSAPPAAGGSGSGSGSGSGCGYGSSDPAGCGGGGGSGSSPGSSMPAGPVVTMVTVLSGVTSAQMMDTSDQMHKTFVFAIRRRVSEIDSTVGIADISVTITSAMETATTMRRRLGVLMAAQSSAAIEVQFDVTAPSILSPDVIKHDIKSFTEDTSTTGFRATMQSSAPKGTTITVSRTSAVRSLFVPNADHSHILRVYLPRSSSALSGHLSVSQSLVLPPLFIGKKGRWV